MERLEHRVVKALSIDMKEVEEAAAVRGVGA